MTVIASITQHTKHVLSMAINRLGIENLGPQRPFATLFLGAFLLIGFFPLLTYVVFASVAICIGVFLLVVIEGGIIAVATVTLMVALILPACIACGLSLFGYTIYVALSQMKFLVGAAVNAPQKLFSGDWFDSEDSEVKFDEKPKFEGKVRCRRARKTSDAPGRDSVSEESDVEGTKPNVLPRVQHRKELVLPQTQWMEETDRVRA